MAEGNTSPYPEWRHLWSHFAPILEHGQMLTYAELKSICKLDVQSSRGRTQFLRFKREVLIELRFYLDNIRNEGYRVCYANEYTRPACAQGRKAGRCIARQVTILQHTPVEELTSDERRHHTDQLIRAVRVARAYTDNETAMEKAEERYEKRLSPIRAPSPIALPPSQEEGSFNVSSPPPAEGPN